MKNSHLLKVLFIAIAMIIGSNMAKAQCHAKYKVKISNDTATFTDSSYTSTGKIANYIWNFGDGVKSSSQSPVHVYANSGTYWACLTIITSGGCKDSICDSVHITVPAPKCDASFGFYTSKTNSDSLHFYGKNTAKKYKTYAWSFGDGTYSTDPYPWHYYSKTGKYYICLKVTDSNSAGTCTDTKCDSVQVGSTVTAPKCDATFAFYNSGTNADSLHFYPKNTSLKAKTYYWSFGDGSYSGDPNPWHYYKKSGKYYICLTTTDSNSAGTCKDTKCDSVQVGSTASAPICDASIGFYNSGTNTDSVHFYPKSTKTYKTYAWSFGDGTYSTDQYPWHYYNKPGKYYVCLKVTDSTSGGKCYDIKCDSIQVGSKSNVPKCEASFVFYYSKTNSDSVHFYPKNTSYKYKTYAWSFGDGHYATGMDPWHKYLKPGKYYVCMRVTDSTAGGTCYDVKCDSITIATKAAATKCDASFGFYNSTTNKDSLHFYGKNTAYKYKTYSWSFGDGTYSNDPYPWHYYKPGKYYICLKVTDSTFAGKCDDIKCDSVQVGSTNSTPKCEASFVFYNSKTNSDSVHFYPKNTSYKYKTYAWSFGDGHYATGMDPWHKYLKPGKYYVCMRVTDSTASGTCYDVKCDSITITKKSAPTCDATFTYYHNTTNKVDSVILYAKSSYKYKSYAWNFGDGTYSNDKEPWHYYKTGKYYVCLTVTDSNSTGTCSDTKCDSITVSKAPATKYYLYGSVDFGKGGSLSSGDYGRAWAIKYDSATGTLTAVDSTKLDSTHHYTFYLDAGDYLVKAALDAGSTNYKQYVPTYYESRLHWDSALVVHLNAHKTNVNIHMISGKNSGGPGFIGGYVSQGANKTEAKGDPIAGVEVILYNESMEAIGYTYSKADGTYGFDNLAYGTYYVHPEVVGKQTYQLQVSIGSSKDSRRDVNISVNSLYAVVEMGVDVIMSTENAISNIYPNPVSDVLNITMNTEKIVTGKICIVDIQGKTILEQNINNKNNIQLDVAQLPQGIYNIMLQTKTGETFSRRFVKQ